MSDAVRLPEADPTEDYDVAYRRLTEALRVLEGRGSATGIANYLSDRDFGGRRHSAPSCPLASYLTNRVGADVLVGGEQVSVCIPHPFTGTLVFVDTPEHCDQFVRLFDTGVYPDLDVSLRD